MGSIVLVPYEKEDTGKQSLKPAPSGIAEISRKQTQEGYACVWLQAMGIRHRK